MANYLPSLRFFYVTALISGLFLALLPAIFAQDRNQPDHVRLIEIKGPIGPATSDFMVRNVQRAAEVPAELIILRLDTPGGLDAAMRDMVSAILASPVPVATWVAPGGARAASAGTYITYASHFAAMAPATNIGSSTPVSIGGSPAPFPGEGTGGRPAPAEDGETSEDNGEATRERRQDTLSDMERKVINDAVAYLKGLAELRGRNVEWAEKTVREAANLSASEALAENVIDLIARDLDELLAGLNGRSVEIHGREVTLSLDNPQVEIVEPDWRYNFLSVITNPNVAYILLMIGIYGIILEFYNPGMGVPGITGVICLLLAAFALQMLPINYAGLALIVVGIVLMVVEVFSPSFGVFGIGGLAAFVLGSVMLLDADLPGYQISIPLIAALATGTGGLILITLGALVRSRRQAVTSGAEAMVGAEAVALENFEHKGHVRAMSENWTAVTDVPVNKGDRLVIEKLDGLLLRVHKSPDNDPDTAG